MSVNKKMIAIADEIRELTNINNLVGLDTIASHILNANNEVDTQNTIIEELLYALEGKAITGSHLNTYDATATADDIVIGETAYAKGVKLTGTNPYEKIATDTEIETQEAALIEIANILETKAIGERSLTFQNKTVTPTASTQTIEPDNGYIGLSSVIVNGDTNLIADNIKNGVSIFGVTGNVKSNIETCIITIPHATDCCVTYFNGTSLIIGDDNALRNPGDSITVAKNSLIYFDYCVDNSINITGDANLLNTFDHVQNDEYSCFIIAVTGDCSLDFVSII